MYNNRTFNQQVSSTPIQLKITGSTLDECKEQLYKQFSTDYEIVDYRIVMQPRFFGILSPKPMVEATYITKNTVSLSKPSDYYRSSQASYGDMPPGVHRAGTAVAPREDFASARDNILKQQMNSPSQNAIKDLLKNAQISKQLEDIKDKIDSLSQKTAERDEHPTIVKLERLLNQNEFSVSYIEEIKTRIRKDFSMEELDDFDFVRDAVVGWIGDDIKISGKYKGKTPHVIVIVGPTGVGKTTTIAKMASKVKYLARKGNIPKGQQPVMHMITIDNMRVAAAEQLEHYGEALDVSVEKAGNKDDLEDLYRLYNDPKVKYIFIDTSGFSPNDNKNIAGLVKMLDIPKMHADIFLAVSASTKTRDLEKILRNYEPFNFRSVIITKCDETSSYGNILSVLHEKGKSISWITTGQEVLNTLEPASQAYFLKALDGFDVDENYILHKFPTDTVEEQ
ncbi:MAG: hypothetical protein IJ828_03790 [Treponema sp.]|nr:hypothetical protein [Treponema sp.]